MPWLRISTPSLARLRFAPRRSAPGRSAIIRTPDKFAPAKFGFSFTGPPRMTRLSIELPERSAPANFAPMSHAPFRFARASFAPAKFDETSRLPNRFAPERSARAKSMLLKSRSERSLPARFAGARALAWARIVRTPSAVSSAAHDNDNVPSAATASVISRRGNRLTEIPGSDPRERTKLARVESQVILDVRRDEKIAVVVAIAQAQVEADARSLARILQQFRLELAFAEGIARSLVDQDRRPCPAAIFDQCRRVVVPPAATVVSKVACQRLFAPRATHGRGYRSEGRYRPVDGRVPERNDERAVAAHRVTE